MFWGYLMSSYATTESASNAAAVRCARTPASDSYSIHNLIEYQQHPDPLVSRTAAGMVTELESMAARFVRAIEDHLRRRTAA